MISRLMFFVRYNTPASFRIITLIITVSLLVFTAYRAVPFDVKQQYINNTTLKFSYFKEWLHYTVRSWSFMPSEDTHIIRPLRRTFGNFDGMTSDGRVVLRLYNQDGISRVSAELADLIFIDVARAAAQLNKYKRQQVAVDYYQYESNGELHDCVVIWVRDEPINKELVDLGVAKPFENPPTNIVNEMMKTYYWSLLK